MRKYIDILTESMRDIFNFHIKGEIAYLETMIVFERRQGYGRKIYTDWENGLPGNVKYVLLDPVDGGAGPSNGFWEKMGFSYQFVDDDPEYEVPKTMIKGVNGNPTPPPTDWFPDGPDEDGF